MDELITWVDGAGAEHRTPRGQVPDDLEEVPEHRNDLGDACPYSGAWTADGTCPQWCHEADVLADYHAGERELPGSTDLNPELYEETGGVKYAVHPGMPPRADLGDELEP